MSENADLKAARKMMVAAIQEGDAEKYILAAELFEKCEHWEDARVCREDAARLQDDVEVLP